MRRDVWDFPFFFVFFFWKIFLFLSNNTIFIIFNFNSNHVIMSKRPIEQEEETRHTASKQGVEDTPHDKMDLDEEEVEFEDPYGDDFDDSEEEIFEAGDEDEENLDEEKLEEFVETSQSRALQAIQEDAAYEEKSNNKTKGKNQPQIYVPGVTQLGPNEVLEADPSTYDMLHWMGVDWPCLSFDILEDNLGDERRNYPHSTYVVTGTQAQKARDNKIMVMKMSSLGKTLVNEDDDEDLSDDEVDADPILEYKSLPTPYTTNRIRVSPFARQTGQYLTASMSEGGDVFIWDVSQHFRSFDNPGTTITKQMNRPIHTIQVHGRIEGYAVDWSPLIPTGSLLTGDISGRIHLTNRGQSSWTTDRTPFEGHDGSVEEIQWSRSEQTVFASAGTDGFIRIWDIRSKKHQPALSVKASNTDINVMSWNPKVSYLLASGHDDGQWGVWDLRTFKPNAKPNPVASFDFHKKAITSIEFHPTEDSTIAVASEDGSVTLWDLAVEADDDEIKQQQQTYGALQSFPPQYLFGHQQTETKEVHWHKQIPGTLISTGSDNFCVWKTISV
jgi:ribosome assembly protein RRB1